MFPLRHPFAAKNKAKRRKWQILSACRRFFRTFLFIIIWPLAMGRQRPIFSHSARFSTHTTKCYWFCEEWQGWFTILPEWRLKDKAIFVGRNERFLCPIYNSFSCFTFWQGRTRIHSWHHLTSHLIRRTNNLHASHCRATYSAPIEGTTNLNRLPLTVYGIFSTSFDWKLCVARLRSEGYTTFRERLCGVGRLEHKGAHGKCIRFLLSD